MTKQAGRISKRLVIIIVSVVTLAFLGVAAYFGYQWYQPQHKAVSTAQQKVNDYHLAGSQDIATHYVALLDAGKTTEAQRLFVDAAAKEPDVNKKVVLFTQNTQLALFNKHPDEAVAAAKEAVAVQPTDDTYMLVVTACVTKNDVAQQIIYLQKAIEALNGSNKPNKAALLAQYQDRLQVAQKIEAINQRFKRG